MKRRKKSIAKRKTCLRTLQVQSLRATAAHGVLQAGWMRLGCALGRAGITFDKREGDGATPAGRHGLRRLWHRGGRAGVPRTGLPTRRIGRRDGWCDAPEDPNYNRAVRLPHGSSAEQMWREDGLYRFVVEIGWNDAPRRKGRGSAIFLHVARPGLLPTEGCVAIRADDFAKLLPRIGIGTRLVIGPVKAGVRRR